MDIGLKRQQVSLWLEQLYGDEVVPEFELNADTISHLYQLSTLCKKNDKNVQLLIDDLQQKCEEYNAEAQRLAAVLGRLSLGQEQFSQSGSSSLLTLAKLGGSLHVKDASETSYFLALQELDAELDRVEEQRREEAKRLKQLTEKSHTAMVKVNSLC
ncbi:HAUS augmin-like complex subunit 1, partial [Aplysia californica]